MDLMSHQWDLLKNFQTRNFRLKIHVSQENSSCEPAAHYLNFIHYLLSTFPILASANVNFGQVKFGVPTYGIQDLQYQLFCWARSRVPESQKMWEEEVVWMAKKRRQEVFEGLSRGWKFAWPGAACGKFGNSDCRCRASKDIKGSYFLGVRASGVSMSEHELWRCGLSQVR